MSNEEIKAGQKCLFWMVPALLLHERERESLHSWYPQDRGELLPEPMEGHSCSYRAPSVWLATLPQLNLGLLLAPKMTVEILHQPDWAMAAILNVVNDQRRGYVGAQVMVGVCREPKVAIHQGHKGQGLFVGRELQLLSKEERPRLGHTSTRPSCLLAGTQRQSFKHWVITCP